MLKCLRTMLVLVAIAAFACGNALNALAEVSGHLNGGVVTLTTAGHAHVHTSGHSHDTTTDQDGVHTADACQGSVCEADEHPDHPCCHTHAHCCGFAGFLPAPFHFSALTSSGQYLAHFDGAVPLGGIVYPLLRPPRLTV